MSNLDTIVFGNKKYGDLLKDIYNRNVKKEQELTGLIVQLKDLISTVQDAVTMVPLIAQYMGMSVKNDDNLIKMAAIVQKTLDRGDDTGDFMFTEDEKAKLLEEAEKLQEKMLASSIKGSA
jgi:hypothetical protein